MSLIPNAWKIPGAYKAVEFAQGVSGANGGNRKPQLLAKMLPTGLGTPNVSQIVTSENEVITLAGSGSDAHRAARAFFKESGGQALNLLLYPETSGSGATKADGYVHLSGTATGTGWIKITSLGEDALVNVSPGDTDAAVATKLAAILASRQHLSFTGALTDTSRVTMTAKHNGASMNGVIRFYVENYNTGFTITTSGASLGTGFGVVGADGTSTENEAIDDALTTQGSDRFYWRAIAVNGSTSNGYLKAHLVGKASALTSLAEVGILASVASLSTNQSTANTLNYERIAILAQANSQHDVAELTGIALGVRVLVETQDPAKVMDGFKPSTLLPIHKTEVRPVDVEINEALLDGVTVVNTRDNIAYIVKSVTTRSKDTVTGLIDDQRVADTAVVSGADYALDTISEILWLTYANKKVIDDPKTASGAIDFNAINRKPIGVVCPHLIKQTVVYQLRTLENAAILADVDASVAATTVRLSPGSNTRVEVYVPMSVINSIHQVTTDAKEVGQR